MSHSTPAELVSVDVHKDDPRIVTLTLLPVNSMNLEFWKALLAAIQKVEADDSIRTIIFTSGLKYNVFTAGLDINELYAPETTEKRLMTFWGTLSTCLTKIYGSKKHTIAAVSGACPAGGCCLALCCDTRIVTEDCSMGLNEIALGIAVPRFWIARMEQVIGHRHTERLLFEALMPKAPEMLKIGMVDQVLPLGADLAQTRAALMAQCVNFTQKFSLAFPDLGYQITKLGVGGTRTALFEAWAAGGPTTEAATVWNSLQDPKTVASLKLEVDKTPVLKLEAEILAREPFSMTKEEGSDFFCGLLQVRAAELDDYTLSAEEFKKVRSFIAQNPSPTSMQRFEESMAEIKEMSREDIEKLVSRAANARSAPVC